MRIFQIVLCSSELNQVIELVSSVVILPIIASLSLVHLVLFNTKKLLTLNATSDYFQVYDHKAKGTDKRNRWWG